MGAQNLPEGQTSDNEMNELAAIVAREQFKAETLAFFTKYCSEFNEEEENKLQYT